MLQQGLKITWKHSTEYIPIDPVDADEQTSVSWTIEHWPATGRGASPTWVTYIVTSTISRVGEAIELRLRYRPSDQTDKRVRELEHWGESLITWRSTEKFGEACWTDDAHHDADGTVDVEIIYLPKERSRETVERNARPEQRNLREVLLAMDGVCAISGERTPEVLEAAHIKSVSDGGVECPTNAILLRADLHLLFDAELLSFKKTSAGVVVQCTGISEGYEAYHGAKPLEAITQRIAHQLPEE